jgi:hypothetical protein
MRAVAVVALLGALAACGSAPARWIEDARAANLEADALTAAGDPVGAARVLEHLVSRPPPKGVAVADARAVLQDAFARRAALDLRAGAPHAALEHADAGLRLGDGGDVFAAALHAVRGRALEALARDAEAVRGYESAQRILEALLNEAIGDGGLR